MKYIFKDKKSTYIYFSGLITIILIASSFIITNSIKKDVTDKLLKEYVEQEQLIAVQLAQILELEISNRESELKLIAKLPEIIHGNEETCNKKLEEISNNPDNKLDGFVRTDVNDIFKCSVYKELIGVDGKKFGAYMDEIFKDPEHKPVMSRIIKRPEFNDYIISIHVPVWDENNNFTGTVGGAINLNDLKKNYMKDIQLSKGGYVSLYDDDGTVLSNPKPELIGTNIVSTQFQKLLVGASKPEKVLKDIKAGIPGTKRYFFDGDEKIAAFEPVDIFINRKWRVVVTLPTATVEGNVIKIGVDKILSFVPTVFSIIALMLFTLFLMFVAKKINTTT